MQIWIASLMVFCVSAFAQAMPSELVLQGRIKWKQNVEQSVLINLKQRQITGSKAQFVGTLKTVSRNRTSEQKVTAWLNQRRDAKVVFSGTTKGAVYLRFESQVFSLADLSKKLIPVRIRLEALKDCYGSPAECIPVVEIVDQGVMWVQSTR